MPCDRLRCYSTECIVGSLVDVSELVGDRYSDLSGSVASVHTVRI